MRSLLLLCAILFQAQALATSCRSIPEDEAIDYLNALFQRAPIVAFVDSLNEPDQGATEVAVVRVWKGEIGSTSYLTGRSSLGLIFAERLDDGPLHRIDRDVSTYCVVSILGIGEYIPTVDKLERLWGPGVKPDSPNTEHVASNLQTSWMVSLMIGASTLMLVLAGFLARKGYRP